MKLPNKSEFRQIWQDWKWILSYSAQHKGAIALYVVLGLLSAALSLAGSVVTKYLIDIITGFQTQKLGLLIGLMVGSGLFSLLFESLVSRISARLSISIMNDIQADIFDKIVDADWLSIRKFSNGDILNRFNADIHTVAANAISWLPTVIISCFRFLATFLVILYYDGVMAFIALGSAPVLLLISRYAVIRQRQLGKQAREASSRLMSFETEAFYNFDTIKSFGAAQAYSQKLRDHQDDYKAVTLEHNLFSIRTNFLLSLAGLTVQLISFGYCLYLLWSGAITYGTMTLFLQQRSSLSSAFQKLVGIIPSFLSSSVSAGRIRELTELPREVHIRESRQLDEMASQGFTLKMRDLAFSYEEDAQVITDSAMSAKPGQIVALVGPSGEGKTTLIRMFLGLIHPQAGSAVIVAADGREIPLNADTRHLFAYVPQGNTILSGTIAENLRLVRSDATDEQIIQALKTACAWEFVSKLPQGIHSHVGERGKGLSEGQAQRIAIARAVLRDAPILLLDEATSALDVATERQVLRNLVQTAPNRTCIVTTHRPSVLGLCQRVYRVMDTKLTRLSEEESSRMVMDF